MFYLINKYLSRAEYLPGTSKVQQWINGIKISAFVDLTFLAVETDIKKDHWNGMNTINTCKTNKQERGYKVAGSGRKVQF